MHLIIPLGLYVADCDLFVCIDNVIFSKGCFVASPPETATATDRPPSA